MRWGSLVLVALLGVGAWYVWPRQKAEVPAPPPVIQEATPRVVCPVCSGEGQLMLRQKNRSDTPYACQACGGRGYRELSLPAGAKLCPDCGGMGKCAHKAGTRVTAKPCMRCNSMGYLKYPPAK
jgi:predicted RNA-binding Zn-ribbon protein involved in translation (DUF1610 family)